MRVKFLKDLFWKDFHLPVLDEFVLAVAQMYRQDVLALTQEEVYDKGKMHAPCPTWRSCAASNTQLLCFGYSW